MALEQTAKIRYLVKVPLLRDVRVLRYFSMPVNFVNNCAYINACFERLPTSKQKLILTQMSVFYSCPTFQCLYIFQDLLYLLRANAGLFPTQTFISLLIYFPCKIAQTRNQNKTTTFAVIKRHLKLKEGAFVDDLLSANKTFLARCHRKFVLMG